MSLTFKKFENKELNISFNTNTDKSGNPWFEGENIATILGYKDTDKTIRKNVDEEDKKTLPVHMTEQAYWNTFINESGLYSLMEFQGAEV